MKKRDILSTLLAVVAGTAMGVETVTFEDDMPGSVWSFGTNSAVIQTESWTSLDGNVTMHLILSADNGEVVANGGGISLRITSANTNANANRIDSAVISNIADDETLTLKLNVAVSGGPAITNLYMDNLSFNSFASSDTAEFSDGSATFTTADGNNTFGYTGTNTALTGLAPLSVSNAGGLGNGTWELSISARDGMVGGTGALVRTEFQFEDITIGFDRNGNIAPVVTTKSITNNFDNVRTVVMNATDPDSAPSPLTFSIVTGTINGSLGPVYDVNKVDYTPNTGFVGSDSFTFAADDGSTVSLMLWIVPALDHNRNVKCFSGVIVPLPPP